MTRELTRGHLEALLIASAIVRPDVTELLERVDASRVTPAARALLAQLADDAAESVQTSTLGQTALADRVEAITLGELLFYSLETLIGLVNRLPEIGGRARASAMDIGVEAVA